MNSKITIKSTPIGSTTEVSGFVGKSNIITLSNGTDGVWHVAMSSALPCDFVEASIHLECMQRTLARAREHGAPGSAL